MPDLKDEIELLKKYYNFDIAGYSKPNMQILKPYYTKVMNHEKNVSHMIVIMNATDFLKHGFGAGKDAHLSDDEGNKIFEKVKNYNNLMKPNTRWALPVIDLRNKTRMGAFRVATFKKCGISKVPALICGSSILEIQDWLDEKNIRYDIYVR